MIQLASQHTVRVVRFTPSGTLVFAGTAFGEVFRSTDDGQSFELFSQVGKGLNGFPYNILDMAFFDDSNGLIAASTTLLNGSAAILRTVDGGLTWTPAHEQDKAIFRVQCLPNGNAFAGAAFGRVLKTTDGGVTWTVIQAHKMPGFETGNNIYGVSFVSPLSGIVVGTGKTVLRTDDGGTTWTPQVSGFPDNAPHIHDVHLLDSQRGIIVGAGTYSETLEGGSSWVNAGTPVVNDEIHTVKSLSASEAIIIASGYLLRLSMGIVYRIPVENASTLWGVDSHGSTVLVSGGMGRVFRSTDFGNSFGSGSGSQIWPPPAAQTTGATKTQTQDPSQGQGKGKKK